MLHRKKIAFLLIVVIALAAVVVLWITSGRSSETVIDYPIDSSGLLSVGTYQKKDGYQSYINHYAKEERPLEEILIPAESYTMVQGMDEPTPEAIQGLTQRAVRTGADGAMEWQFHVKKAGLYQIDMTVSPAAGKDSDVERELRIDGELPFTEAKSLMFQRIWKDESTEVVRDARGNDLTPKQMEEHLWQTIPLKDGAGYEPRPFLFYFSEGEHTLQLISVKEPMDIANIRIYNPLDLPTYEEVAKSYESENIPMPSDVMIKVQGEDASLKSSPSLLPFYHRASPAVEPYSVSKQRNNVIGGYAWRAPSQWLEWEIEVPEDGLYTLSMKYLQNFVTGSSTLRSLTIDGDQPFKEAERIGFPFSTSWQMKTLGKDEHTPYLFHLTKGKHAVRLEVSLGEYAPIIRAVESSILELNSMYREIISFTGTVPDTYRDYQLDQRIPEMTSVFQKHSETLLQIGEMIQSPSGGKERAAILNTLAYQLQDMAARPDTVPSRIETFSTNVGALGAWIPTLNEQPLTIDYLIVASPDVKLPDPEASQMRKLYTGVQQFAASFVEKYDQFSLTEEEDKVINVWVTTARDQALILNRLIADRFTPDTGIHVNLKLVPAGVLLPSTIAGKGPDVALEVGNELPVNYATRNAVADLTQFDDYEKVTERFHPSATVPYQFNDKAYALPETQTFPVMFYRKDILVDELNLEVPRTWDELMALIPKLQKRNLQVGLPERPLNTMGNETANTDVVTLPPNPTYSMLLFQNGGSLYKDDGMESGLDEEIAVQVFKKWTDLYVNYKLPIRSDIANRFRTGEMPVVISDYTLFNKLNVFAPEIKGLWEFTSVPGVKMAAGAIHKDVGSSGTAAIMMESSENKQEAWEFLKWWTTKETQVAFGRELEIRMGASARYPTANLEALDELPWQTSDLNNLKEQFQWVRGIPEVPGGYFTGRHLDNAFRKVVVQGEDARESLDYYLRYINEEITLKRQEFNLPYKK